jgi:putative flippase GtrA
VNSPPPAGRGSSPNFTGDGPPPQTSAAPPDEWRRFALFLAVGVLNTAFGYVVFAAFILLGSPNAVAVAGMTVLGCLFNYVSYGRIVFAHRGRSRLARFVGSYVVVGVANGLLLELVVMGLGFSPLIGQFFCIPVMAVLSFVLQRTWVFGDRA